MRGWKEERDGSSKILRNWKKKKIIARVYLVPGTGKVTINKRDIDNYFGIETLKVIVRQPLDATKTKTNLMLSLLYEAADSQARLVLSDTACKSFIKSRCRLQSSIKEMQVSLHETHV